MTHPLIRHPLRLLAGIAFILWWPFRWIWRGWWNGLTAFGKYLLTAFLVAAAASLVSLNIPIFHYSVTMLFLFVGAFFYSRLFCPRLILTANCPRTVKAGEKCTVSAKLQNVNSISGYEIITGFDRAPRHITVLDCDAIAIGGRDSATTELKFIPEERGRYLLGNLNAFTLFPFGLFRRQVNVRNSGPSEISITALPKFHRIEHLDLPFKRKTDEGIKLAERSGQSNEYFGSRDYRPGDSVRRFDHRAWGRLGAPTVREYEMEHRDSSVLFLDTTLPHAATRRRSPQFEAAVSITAALADYLCEQNRLDGCLLCGRRSVHEPGASVTLEDMLEALGIVEHETESGFEPSAAQVVESTSSRFVLVLLAWDEPRRALVKRLLERGSRVKVVLVSEEQVNETESREPELPPGNLHPDNLCVTWLHPEKISSGEATSV